MIVFFRGSIKTVMLINFFIWLLLENFDNGVWGRFLLYFLITAQSKSNCFFSVDSFPVEYPKQFNQPNLPLLFRCCCVGSAYQKDAKRRGTRSVRRDAFPNNVTQLIDGYFVGEIVSFPSTGLFIFEIDCFCFYFMPLVDCNYLFQFILIRCVFKEFFKYWPITILKQDLLYSFFYNLNFYIGNNTPLHMSLQNVLKTIILEL